MSKKALVTGAAGFIGKHVASALILQGWEVVGFDILPKPDALECAWVRASILDKEALGAAMAGCHTVFHLAARAHLFAQDPAIFDAVNRAGTGMVVDAARRQSVEQLLITLSAVALTPVGFKGHIDGLTSPDDPNCLAGPYARSKWGADQFLDTVTDLNTTRFYPTVPIGPGDDAFTAPTQMIKMFLTSPPPAILRTALNFAPVEDIAQAHVRAAENWRHDLNNQQRRYLLSAERWPLSTLLEYLDPLTDKTMPRRQVPYTLARFSAHVSEAIARLRHGDSLATVEGLRMATADPTFTPDAAKRDLDWAPGAVAEALERLIIWMQPHLR